MVTIENLGLKYRARGNWTFRNHTLRARSGEVVAVIGPNGRGKTTLIKSIIGLYRAREGSVLFDGAFGYVPQTTEASFPYCTRDMVVMGRARQIRTFRSPDPGGLSQGRYGAAPEPDLPATQA